MTSGTKSIARPYAKALYEIALSSNSLADWNLALKELLLIAQHAEVLNLLANPAVTKEQKHDFFSSVAREACASFASIADDHLNNFIKLLIVNNRISSIPMISEIYEMLMNQHNDQANITIATAEAISDGDIKAISALLEKKYNKSINIENFVDNEIIGGARVMTNQSVIDGSLKNKLNKLTLWLRK